MEFTVKKSDLLQELALAQAVVERKTTVPILSNVLLRANGTNRVGVVATGMDVSFKSGCPAVVAGAGAVTLPARCLYQVVRSLPDKEIHFKRDDGDWVTVVCGSGRFRIAGLTEDDFPNIPDPRGNAVAISADGLSRLIHGTICAVSTDGSKYQSGGALLLLKPGSAAMVATDGHRLSYVRKEQEIGVPETARAVVPKKAMGALARMLADDADGGAVTFSDDGDRLFFGLGDRLLVSQALIGRFPSWEKVMPENNGKAFVIGRDRIAAMIRRVATMADRKSKNVCFFLARGSLRIVSSDSGLGEASETTEVDYGNEEFQVAINYQYLLDFLETVPSGVDVSCEFKDGASSVEFRPLGEEDCDHRYVVMPMRI